MNKEAAFTLTHTYSSLAGVSAGPVLHSEQVKQALADW